MRAVSDIVSFFATKHSHAPLNLNETFETSVRSAFSTNSFKFTISGLRNIFGEAVMEF